MDGTFARLLPLGEVVREYAAITGSGNAHDWYRRQANADGCVRLGGQCAAAFKVGNRWMVDAEEVADSFVALKNAKAERERASKRYEDGELDGTLTAIETTWGSYMVRGAFHLVTQRRSKPYRGGGVWHCNECMRPANLEHNKPECHRCSDWSSCGRDCTLSAVRCTECGTQMDP